MVDIKGAYLNGNLDNTVYLQQPEGIFQKGEENLICKLNKSIYGLKQSEQVWHETMRQEMKELALHLEKQTSRYTVDLEIMEKQRQLDGMLMMDSQLQNDGKNGHEHHRQLQDLGNQLDYWA